MPVIDPFHDCSTMYWAPAMPAYHLQYPPTELPRVPTHLLVNRQPLGVDHVRGSRGPTGLLASKCVRPNAQHPFHRHLQPPSRRTLIRHPLPNYACHPSRHPRSQTRLPPRPIARFDATLQYQPKNRPQMPLLWPLAALRPLP